MTRLTHNRPLEGSVSPGREQLKGPSPLLTPTPPSPLVPFQRSHIQGLDSLRFISSCWVMISHFGPLFHVPGTSALAQAARALVQGAFNGGAAVMVFFVISGFCIHRPQIVRELDIPVYYLRRYIRIGLPCMGAQAMASLFPGGRGPLSVVMWSLYCEMAYYTIYPLILMAVKKWNWVPIFILSCVFSACVIPFHAKFIFEAGYLTWLAALPIWLLGCMAAEIAPSQNGPFLSMIPVRVIMWILSVAWMFMTKNGIFPGAWSTIIFGILAAGWITMEVNNFQKKAPHPILEYLGAMSYSLYLCHPIVLAIIPSPENPALYHLWPFVRIAFALVLGYGFYLLIERPSHSLAKAIRRSHKNPAR